MEPECLSQYSTEDYWNVRYKTERKYEWFPSVYEDSLNYIIKFLLLLSKERNLTSKDTLNVLHLGCGNSSLITDIHNYWNSLPEHNPSLHQIGLDFSPVVINNMKEEYDNDKINIAKSSVSWVVGDIRRLKDVSQLFACPIDIIIDKGTMDALQANKENENLHEELSMMLKGIEDVLRSNNEGQEKNLKAFLQITWEIPYCRFAITNTEDYCWYSDKHPKRYVWDHTSQIPEDHIWYTPIGGSDMYYMFVYRAYY